MEWELQHAQQHSTSPPPPHSHPDSRYLRLIHAGSMPHLCVRPTIMRHTCAHQLPTPTPPHPQMASRDSTLKGSSICTPMFSVPSSRKAMVAATAGVAHPTAGLGEGRGRGGGGVSLFPIHTLPCSSSPNLRFQVCWRLPSPPPQPALQQFIPSPSTYPINTPHEWLAANLL